MILLLQSTKKDSGLPNRSPRAKNFKRKVFTVYQTVGTRNGVPSTKSRGNSHINALTFLWFQYKSVSGCLSIIETDVFISVIHCKIIPPVSVGTAPTGVF